MTRLLFVLGLLMMTVVAGFEYIPCGHPAGCECAFRGGRHVIYCAENCTVFPVFLDDVTSYTTVITFEQSRFDDLLPFDPQQWPSLYSVIFIDMPQLQHYTLDRLHAEGITVSVIWDLMSPPVGGCGHDTPSLPSSPPPKNPDAGCVVATLIMAVICLIAVCVVGMFLRPPLVR